MRESEVLENMKAPAQVRSLSHLCLSTLTDIKTAMIKADKGTIISLIEYLDILMSDKEDEQYELELEKISTKYREIGKRSKTRNTDVAPFSTTGSVVMYAEAMEKFRALRKLISRKGVVQW